MQALKVAARDLMQTKVVKIDVSATVAEAVRFLEDAGYSGAPVTDPSGRVCGVISLTDLAEATESSGGMPGSQRSDYYFPYSADEGVDRDPDEYSAMEDYSPAAFGTGTVADWMTQEVIAVAPGDSLRKVAQVMVQHRVHRVLVLEDGKLAGILTTMDFVRRIAEKG